ncbi:hypothetical protein [Pseudenhygromyxa sp. WMMC2535]|uniref:hypothetical protein n=1 Tax=Pseudenhygromyxa sp. WMMC2535 TaxID=2712867 RepID=UPI001C3DB6CA|nr:hypothetical protein [Pseudenhygromyxa sp. WMMC2535]
MSLTKVSPRLALLALATLATTACDPDAYGDIGASDQAESFYQGMAKDTEGGAFRVTLSTREGGALVAQEPTGLIVRVGFHDPEDPSDPGQGIPEADLLLDAWTTQDSARAPDPVYIGDGRYLFEAFELEEGGVWHLDLAIAVGATLDESVQFNLLIPDAS